LKVKCFDSIKELPSKLHCLRIEEESGIPGVRVKSVDIGRNTCGESGSLANP
jgi:hypothetical protein